MAVFGGYESVRKFSASASHTVWTARPAGAAGEPLYAIKQVRVEEIVDLLGPEDAAREVERLFDSASVQERLAKQEGSRWAAVHVKARSAEGAYCVTDLFFDGGVPSTALSLIRGASSTRLTHATLRAIVEAVAQGLAQIHALGRPHGRLKASNVLISWAGDIPSRVMLTDPAPNAVVSGHDVDEDITALGELIHELVLKRPYSARGGWPLPSDEAWRALGSTGEAWRRLCETLLNPSRKPGEISASDIPAMLPVERRAGPSKKVIAIGGAVAVIVVTLVVVVITSMMGGGDEGGQKERITSADWNRLMSEDDVWLRQVRVRLAEGRLGDDSLALEVGVILREHGVAAGERRPLHEVFLVDADRERFTRSTGYEDEGAAVRAQAFLPALEKIDAAVRAWPARARLREAAEAAEAMRMPKRAQDLRDRAVEHESASELLDRIDRIAGAIPVAERILAIREKVGALTARGRDLGDPLLSRIGELVAERGELAAELDQLDRMSQALEMAEAATRRELFLDAAAREAFLVRAREIAGPPERPIAMDAVAQWESATRSDDFRVLEGENPLGGWRERLAAVSRAIEGLTFQGVAQDKLDECVRQRAMAETKADEAGALVEAVSAVPRIRLHERSHQEQGGEIQRRLGEIEALVASLARCGLRDPGEIRMSMRQPGASRVASGSVVVQAEYRRRLDEALGRVDDASIEGAFDALQSLFERLDAGTTVSLEGASRFASTLEREREEAIRSFFADPGWAGAWATGEIPKYERFEPRVAEVRERLAALAARAAAVSASADRLKALVDEARVFDDKLKRDVALFMRDSAEFHGELGTLVPVLRGLEGVWGLAERGDAGGLARVIEGTEAHASVALEAWRGLKDAEIPLLEVAGLRDRLIGLAGTVASEARRREIIAEVKGEAAERWRRHARGARTGEAFERAVALAERFEVTAESVADPVIAYNWLVMDFSRYVSSLGGKGDDEAVRARVRAFLDEASALAARVAGERTAASAMLAKLEDLIRPTDAPPPPKATEIGPAALIDSPWRASLIDGPSDAVRFEWSVAGGGDSRVHVLEFVLVEPSDAPPAYVCTTEMSLGLFLDLMTGGRPMNDSPLWEVSRELMQRTRDRYVAPETPSDRGTGPHVWVWGSTDARRPAYWRINVAPSWVVPPVEFRVNLTDRSRTLSPYPEDLFQLIEGEQRPTLDHPMHWVRPDAAVYAAWLAGCRLPTAAEWLAAHVVNERAAGVGERIVPNRRDHTGRRQLEYARANRAEAVTFVLPDQRSLWEGAASGPDHWPESAVPGDETLWFEKVGTGGGVFKHLVGNVAEMVISEAYAEAMDAGLAAGATPQAARDFVLSGNGAIGVIGASAQSPNDLDPTEFHREVRSPAGVNKLQGADWRFADVGFRLAFSSGGAARPRPLAQRVAEVFLETPRYILAP